MADYFPVLSDAVAKLENNTGEARRAVYERARAAIVRQLRAIDPPLSEDVISRERMQLEEAIRKVEAKAGGAAPAAAAQPAPPPPARPEPTPAPQRPREEAPADETPRAARPEAANRGPKRPEAGPAKRADGRPIVRVAGGKDTQAPKQRSGAVIGLIAIAVIALGVGLFAARGHIAGLFGGSKTSSQTAEQAKPAEEKTAEQPATDAGKSDDRLPQDGGSPPPAGEQQAAREAPPATAPAQPETQPAPSGTSGPIVAQRATLYEEGPNQQSGEAVGGTVLWRSESVPGGQGQPLETAIRGDIDIPGRKLKAVMTIRRNADATLPASHTIEVQFQLPDDFANAGISNVPGVLMKANESARGAAVSGLSVRVTNGFFLIGLSNLEMERNINEQLLRDRGWIDVPILYDNGRRAVLTLEKGTPGMKVFQEAFASWAASPSAANQQAPSPQQ